MKDVDIREGYDAIAGAISDCVRTGEPCEIYNSDEDFDGDPAPRAVMVSRRDYEFLLSKPKTLWGSGSVGGSGGGGANGGGLHSHLWAVTSEGKRIDPDEDGVLHCSPHDEIVMIGPGGGGGMKPCGGGMKPCTCPCINCSNGQHWLCHGEGVEIDTVQAWVGSPDDGDDENEDDD